MNAIDLAISLDNVRHVYVGRPGCCCGCSGEHYYPERHRDDWKELRGWGPFKNEDINDREVQRKLWPKPDRNLKETRRQIAIKNKEKIVKVQELTEGMGGRWLVTTQGSTHEWDLDAMTYKRMPGPRSLAGAFDSDGQRVKITKIDRYPKVGATSFMWFDDPVLPEFVEQWRQSSLIVSIEKMAGE